MKSVSELFTVLTLEGSICIFVIFMDDFFSYRTVRANVFIIVLLMIAVLLDPVPLHSQELQKTGITRYAIIHYGTDEDLLAFSRNIGSTFSFLFNRSRDRGLTAKRVDRLVTAVSALLGMPVLNLRFSVYVYNRQEDLNSRYFALTGKRQAPAAFYDHTSKSIAVSLERISKNILAHEIAHAVICSYFAVPPPAPMQEILARYVDEHLKE